MKKVKFDKKLSLNKETIAKLNNNQMGNVKGGAGAADGAIAWPTGGTGRFCGCNDSCCKGTRCGKA